MKKLILFITIFTQALFITAMDLPKIGSSGTHEHIKWYHTIQNGHQVMEFMEDGPGPDEGTIVIKILSGPHRGTIRGTKQSHGLNPYVTDFNNQKATQEYERLHNKVFGEIQNTAKLP